MKLKYYLRGLGIGMVVTAIIMGVSAGEGRTAMTDEQVKTRAAQLGMIENTVLTARETESETMSGEEMPETDVQPEPVQLPEEKPAEDTAPEETAGTADDFVPADSMSAAESEAPPENTEQMPEITGETKYKVITVRGGDGSYQISQRLQAEGLIEDAVEFDNYLCGSGYSSKIRSGEHRIPEGATEEEIAKLLTSG